MKILKAFTLVALSAASLWYASREPVVVNAQVPVNQTSKEYPQPPVIVGQEAEAAFVSTGPVLDNEEVTVELPPSQHLRNKAGIDGLGLCVFTSVEHAADFQNVDPLRGFRDWMTTQEGGGYPEKLDVMIAKFCLSRGVKVPEYVQHTGGDIAFLKLALAAGRYPAVTYAGHDGINYNGRVAHMVNLVHLSAKYAVIHDNNYPGRYLWMSPQAFETRWKEMGGGWAVVLLAPPPPPIPANLKAQRRLDPVRPEEVFSLDQSGQDCPDGRCPLRQPPVPARYEWRTLKGDENRLYLYLDGVQIGGYDLKEDVYLPYNAVTKVWGPETACPTQKPVKPANANYGVLEGRLTEGPKYSKNGKEVSREDASFALVGGLEGDGSKWRLTAVGSEEFRKQAAEFVAKEEFSPFQGWFLFQSYAAENWAVKDIGMAEGLTLQGPPDKTGHAPVVWRQRAGEAFPPASEVVEGLRRLDPDYRPDRDPRPGLPEVKPSLDIKSIPTWAYVAAAVAVAYLVFSKKEKSGKSD